MSSSTAIDQAREGDFRWAQRKGAGRAGGRLSSRRAPGALTGKPGGLVLAQSMPGEDSSGSCRPRRRRRRRRRRKPNLRNLGAPSLRKYVPPTN